MASVTSENMLYYALHERMSELVDYSMEVDDCFTGLLKTHPSFLDVQLVCESIGIAQNDVFVQLVLEKFHEIKERFCEIIHKNTIPNMIFNKQFTFIDNRDILTDKLLGIVKQFYTQPHVIYPEFKFAGEIKKLPEIGKLTMLYWKNLKLGTKQGPDYLLPHMYNEEKLHETISYDILVPLETVLINILVRNEVHNRFLMWLKNHYA